MKDSNTINWNMTITNPKMFAQPWTMTSAAPMTRRRVAPNYDAEDACHEGNIDLVHLQKVYEQEHGVKVPKPPVMPPATR